MLEIGKMIFEPVYMWQPGNYKKRVFSAYTLDHEIKDIVLYLVCYIDNGIKLHVVIESLTGLPLTQATATKNKALEDAVHRLRMQTIIRRDLNLSLMLLKEIKEHTKLEDMPILNTLE